MKGGENFIVAIDGEKSLGFAGRGAGLICRIKAFESMNALGSRKPFLQGCPGNVAQRLVVGDEKYIAVHFRANHRIILLGCK